MKAVLLLVLLDCGMMAQPPRRIELFGHVGRARLGEDEGSLGSATSWGGILVLPVTGRYAVEIDTQTASTTHEFSPPDRTDFRQSFVNPAFVRRWGTEKFYGLAGGGAGVQWEQTDGVYRVFAGDPPIQTGTASASTTHSGLTLHAKGGLVIAPVSGLVIRTDMILSFRFVLPTIAVRLGAGWRF